MNKILRVIVALLEGLGRSSQIGDFGAFFAAGGSMVIIGSLTQKRTWLPLQ